MITQLLIFINKISGIFDYIGNIFKTLRFCLTGLLTGLGNLIYEVFNGELFSYLLSGFSDLSIYIGSTATFFIVSLFMLILFRIIIAFVFKIFRINLNYKSIKYK